MASEIRELLATAQQAEVRGDFSEAVRVLRLAHAFYVERSLTGRADQMIRHIDRLLPRLAPVKADETLGFGDELLAEGAPSPGKKVDLKLFDRAPAMADPAIDAWCSFCCRPKAEVGALLAGPAGAFICRACVVVGGALFGTQLEVPKVSPAPAPLPVKPNEHRGYDLPSQAKARHRWDTRKPRVGLVVGPAASGKSSFVSSLGTPVRTPIAQTQPIGDLLVVDLHEPLREEDELFLERWLAAHPSRRLVLSVRGGVPAPVLVLKGTHGDEPVYDTAGLAKALAVAVSERLLGLVDAVMPFDEPTHEVLLEVARAQLAARKVEMSEAAVEQLVTHARSSGRGAHELTTLINRIPPGTYA